MQKNKKFITIIWWYHKQIFSFEKEQNYHMLPIEVMKEEGYTCEIFAIDSQVQIEKDPNFIEWTKIIYYKNIMQYFHYLWKNRENIIYSNSLTLKTLFVGVLGKNTVFMAHDQVLPLKSKAIKRQVVTFFYSFFSLVRVINSEEKEVLQELGITSYYLPLSISRSFFKKAISEREGGFFVWNLYEDKNPEFLIKTCKILKNKWVQCTIRIAGEDRYNKNGKSFREVIKENDLQDFFQILWFVPHEKLVENLQESLFFVNTSLSEWQCLTAYEAALAWNILCLQEIMAFPSVFKENALYHKQPSDLAENILTIYKDKEAFSIKVQKNQDMILERYNFQENKKGIKKMFLSLNN